ncbi:hypothetical protein [Bosea sp. BK604]|uniref:hypothetical protein n=1 Tax=Bosea sp. BK604 TaxID=2512180 RepID=UPI0010D92439|nr:hypothetical protein [Bosea sp. BK604]TCR63531.1 hypothetical protein EV560_108178 [Bosea sp. BK604]
MKIAWLIWLMRGFIAFVFVLCLFGPYGLSILIGCLGLGCYFYRNEVGSHL